MKKLLHVLASNLLYTAIFVGSFALFGYPLGYVPAFAISITLGMLA